MINFLKKYFTYKYTVACDRGPFWSPVNEREELFQHKGLLQARRVAKEWCRVHPNGQARIMKGWYYWDETKI